jgi:TatD DNase family protein
VQPAPPLLVDTHVHIAFDRFQEDLEAVALRWRQAGVARLVHSCVEPGEFEAMRRLADRFPELSFAIGLHPLDVDQWTEETATLIRQLAQSDPRVVAIGETGLDFFKSDSVALQKIALRAQLEIAADLGLPVIVHCRDAAAAMAEELEQFQRDRQTAGLSPVVGVMHCWGGTPEETQWFLDQGFFISFSGTVTFSKAEQIQASARMVTSDRLLVETDCPFLAPVPKRGKRNEPAFVAHVAAQVASLRGVPLEELAQQTTQNAFALFNLPALEPSAA